MKVHVLPGDALAEDFKQTAIDGEIIVCRECLVDGPVQAGNLAEFWQVRADFIRDSFGESNENYYTGVVSEFEKLKTQAANQAEINLWFEYELFCQVNLWFCLFLLRAGGTKIYRVAPMVRKGDEIWKGFGNLSTAELEKCYAERVEFTSAEISRGADLWTAFQSSDYAALEKLSIAESKALPYLKKVCRAEIEKSERPRQVLRNIMAAGKTDFSEIFPEFSSQAGVYGFGDSQVKRILAGI